jgi:protein-tyrosine-phosphatase
MKSVLFVCIENACRSQMAEGLAGAAGAGIVLAHSAGSQPSGVVNPAAVEVMAELGIDISSAQSKGFDDLPVRDFDYVVTMGCGDVCPFVPAKEHLDWDMENPAGKDIAFFRAVRDEIRERVADLLKSIADNTSP